MTPTSSVTQASPRELVLYAYWRSSASYRVRLALAAKRLPHRVVPVNLLTAEQSAEPHLERSPTGYVPALVIDGVAFFESIAIIELLDELYPEPALFPTDPFARCRVRALVEIVNAGIQPLQNLNVTKRVDAAHRDEWIQHYIHKGLAAFERAMGVNEAAGFTGDFAFGASLTAADLVLLPQLTAARRFKADLTPFPRILRAEKSALAVPGLDAAAPARQPDAVVAG
jgi:maleylacetoacetate isomerase